MHDSSSSFPLFYSPPLPAASFFGSFSATFIELSLAASTVRLAICSCAATSLYKSKDDKKRILDSIIIVTDRTNLDDQLRGTVRSLSKVDGVVFGAERGSRELREFIEKGKDIIITTIQKFPYISEDINALGDKKFAVIID